VIRRLRLWLYYRRHADAIIAAHVRESLREQRRMERIHG
jgi:hypothetical protein